MNAKTTSYASQSQFPRTKQLTYATIPFQPGEFVGNQEVITHDARTGDEVLSHLKPFGRPYEDGSIRHAGLVAEVTLDSNESTTLVTTLGTPSPLPPFAFGPGLAEGGYQLSLWIRQPGKPWFEGNLSGGTILESNPLRQVIQVTTRVGGGPFVAIFTMTIYARQDTVPFELFIINSDPRQGPRDSPIEEILLFLPFGSRGSIQITNAEAHGCVWHDRFKAIHLIQNTHFADGQGQLWFGRFSVNKEDDEAQAFLAAAERESALWGVSTDWKRDEEAYGMFGHLSSPLLPVTDSGDAAIGAMIPILANHWEDPGNPWGDSILGNHRAAGQGGDHADFGLHGAWPMLYFGGSELVEDYLDAAGADAKRPGHYRELDGRQLRIDEHPNWMPLAMTTHFHAGVSPDRLGKNFDIPTDTHGWSGKDWGHHSSNLLYDMALVTQSPSLMEIVRHETKWLLRARPVPLPPVGHSMRGETWNRTYGRVGAAFMTLDLLVDDPRIFPNRVTRARDALVPEAEGKNPNWSSFEDVWAGRPVVDARIQLPPNQGWCVWQSALCVIGALAELRRGHIPALEASVQKSVSSIVRHGTMVERDASGTITFATIGHGVRFNATGESVLDADGTLKSTSDPDEFRGGWYGQMLVALPVYEWAIHHSVDQATKDRARELVDYIDETRRRYNDYALTPNEPHRDPGLRWTTR